MTNHTLCELLGYDEEDILNFRWQDLTHPEDLLKEIGLAFDIATGDREQYKINKRFVRKDESFCTVVSLVSAIRNPDRELQYLLNQVVDITELNKLKLAAQSKLTVEMRTEILSALQQEEFHLEYEPIVDLKSGNLSGHEGLIRWVHPSKGLIPPLAWIPACEEDPWLMSQVCSYVVRKGVKESIKRNSWVSVNISPVSLTSPSFIDLLADIALISDRPKVYLEITERIPFDFNCLEKLQSLGYGVFLDDFGQGHSSLIQLLEMAHRLHSSQLKIKIDGWFSCNIHNRSTQTVLAEFILILHRLGLEVISECIETEDQLKIWKDLGCDLGQGWYWKNVI